MIALITPTGGRPAQFTLCRQWMLNQDYPGEVTWIIVDDANPVTTLSVGEEFKPRWTIIKIYPFPYWKTGQNTQARNISAGLQALTENYDKKDIEGIFIIEDDDYYRPCYLRVMMSKFKDNYVIGETNTIYYNVEYRRFITNPNTIHASLFQTAFRPEMIKTFNESLMNKFIDCVFWRNAERKYLFYEHDLAVGIKGMPGRGGIGAGHSKAMNMRDDRNMNYLRMLIGSEDAKNYEGYYWDNRVQQHRQFIKRGL